jgi:hypothetical protein
LGAGYYFLQVRFSFATAFITYQLNSNTYTCVIDALEPNNDFLQAKSIGDNELIQGLTFCPSNDQDWFKVFLSKDGELKVIASR